MNNKLPFTKEFGYIRLQRILKPGSHKLREVLDTFGDIERITALSLKEWIESRILTTAELARINKISNDEIYEIIKYCKFNEIRIITPEDTEYPTNFKYIENPPVVIYARGNTLDNTAPTIGIVGARKATEFGHKAAYSLGARLALAGFTVVSGGAVGVDSMAHAGAMKAGGSTVVVLGCGLDTKYLMSQDSLRKKAEICGTVISEFEPKTPASRYTFPIRNRIISALSCGVVVIEAGRKSGALITATYAMEQGKELFALPGNINEPQYGGTNDLLKDGAFLLSDADDITEVYLGRFPDKLKSGERLTKEIRQGYVEELKRMTLSKTSYDNPKIDIQKEERPKSPSPDVSPKPQSVKAEQEKQKKQENSEISFTPTPAEAMTCSNEAKKIYNSFKENTEFSDTLSQRSGVTGGKFIAAITELELFGFIKAVPVGQYERVK
ncbi:MAG: DNA-processing protein DprA [Clostridia bacterium]|nr:DNA-processing protein DprA [Clostridia bacterium]